MPRKDGYQTLRELRQFDEFTSIPVIVMTGSNDSAAAAHSYQLGATLFVDKPADYQSFVLLMDRLNSQWCGLIKQDRTYEHISVMS